MPKPSVLDEALISNGLLTPAGFCRSLDTVVRELNETKHSGLRMTPITKHADDGYPLTVLPDAALATALIRRETGWLSKAGIKFNNVVYWHPALMGHELEDIEIGWLATHPEFIDVFDPNHVDEGEEPEWLCRAGPMEWTSREFANRVYQARKHQIKTVAGLDKRAAQLRAQLSSDRLTPITTTEAGASARAADATGTAPAARLPEAQYEVVDAASHPDAPQHHVAAPHPTKSKAFAAREQESNDWWDTTTADEN